MIRKAICAAIAIARPRLATAALVLASLPISVVAAPQSVQAQTFRLLHAFKGPDGDNPRASFIRDSSGNLYGTTTGGGGLGYGTVFKLGRTHTLTVLHSFVGLPDGQAPLAPVLRDAAGNLYGTTTVGGAGFYFGAVYKIDASGTETVLHSFNGKDGSSPSGTLVRDKGGNLYGTTAGDQSSYGTVFKLDTTGKLTTLHAFTGADGSAPSGSLVRDAVGNLYGTCLDGGTSGGIVYKLDTTGTLTVLHSFGGTDGGGRPYGGVIADTAGNLYGTTIDGGSSNAGTVFRVEETNGSFTLLYNFGGGRNGPEGGYPSGTLARDSVGNLYGANVDGGGGCKRFGGCGTIWKLDTNNQLTVLTNFGKGNQGLTPYGGVILDKAGNLYGTASQGGTRGCNQCGTIFKIIP